MTKYQVVTNVGDLKSLLGDHFILMLGSAVSGVMEPRLPMIYDVMDTFLELTAKRLAEGSYQDRIIAGYAESLVQGYHRRLILNTKFENFVFNLQRSVGKVAVDDLFVRVFRSPRRRYNNNHAAIAYLLRNRACLAALTTNFDNQIERCLPALKTYVFPDKPKNLPLSSQPPIYVKLHGDAATKTYIATSPELSQARSIDTYAFIENLLRNKVILVLGYSGTGDIDIAPHLGKREKLVIWGDLNVDAASAKQPNQVDLICDLSLNHPEMEIDGRRNLLLGLAASYGWKPPKRKVIHQALSWKEQIIDWVQQIPIQQLRDFVTAFMSWRTSWPHVHIAYSNLNNKMTYTSKYEYSRSTVQVAAYLSSEKLLKSLLLTEPPDLVQYLGTIEMLGFTYRGKQRYSMALSIFFNLFKGHEFILNQRGASPDDDIAQLTSTVARLYLETLLEVVNNTRSNKKRREIVQSSKAEQCVIFLEKLRFDTSYYLNQIAVMETRYWLGDPISFIEVNSFFNQCMAMQEWEAAALTAQFMLTLSFQEGSKAANEILEQLKKRNSLKLIRKVRARMIYERINRLIPIQVLNFKAFTDGLLLGVEVLFASKRLLWNLDRWFDQVRVETGFLGFGKVLPRK